MKSFIHHHNNGNIINEEKERMKKKTKQKSYYLQYIPPKINTNTLLCKKIATVESVSQ